MKTSRRAFVRSGLVATGGVAAATAALAQPAPDDLVVPMTVWDPPESLTDTGPVILVEPNRPLLRLTELELSKAVFGRLIATEMFEPENTLPHDLAFRQDEGLGERIRSELLKRQDRLSGTDVTPARRSGVASDVAKVAWPDTPTDKQIETQRINLVLMQMFFEATARRLGTLVQQLQDAKTKGDARQYNLYRKSYRAFIHELHAKTPPTSTGSTTTKAYGKPLRWVEFTPLVTDDPQTIAGIRVIIYWNPHSSSSALRF